MNSSRKTFSKSSYLIFKQCPKYFWYYINDRESIPEHDKRAQFNFTLGHIVGELAKMCYPDGIEVGYYNDFTQNLARTKSLMLEKKPLFEAGILYNNEYYDIYSRADILAPSNKKDQWDIIEVKSSTSIKEVNLLDLAFQKYCYEKAGVKINSCYLMYINNQYIRQDKLDVKQLFTITELTEEVEKIYPHIKNDLKNMLIIANNENFIFKDSDKEPEEKVGKFCDSPFNCPLKEKCWAEVRKDSIFFLYSINKKIISKLMECNIRFIDEIPLDFQGINNKQKIQIECVKKSQPYIDKQLIRQFISKIKYPIYFLDFETFSSPIPLIENTKPYQNIPFQFSLHILRYNSNDPQHYSFIASGNSDPRKELLKNLKEKLNFEKEKGSIIVYNESFEKAILKDLAEYDPYSADWIYSIISNIVDLYEPFRNFYYYNKLQNGSASVKKVLPALTDKSYENLEIANGNIASISFLEKSFLWKNFLKEYNFFERIKNLNNINFTADQEENEEKEIEKLRENLHNYCKLDTEAMIDIYHHLLKIVEQC